MSILLKGIKMPRNCHECPAFDHYNYYCNAYSNYHAERYDYDNLSIPEWCGLVELPEKHGRLIDGNELFKQMNTAIAMMSGMMKAIGAENDEGMQMELKAYKDIRDGIKDCDTVIEAEDKE